VPHENNHQLCVRHDVEVKLLKVLPWYVFEGTHGNHARTSVSKRQ